METNISEKMNRLSLEYSNGTIDGIQGSSMEYAAMTTDNPDVASTISTSIVMNQAYIIIGSLGVVGNLLVIVVMMSAFSRLRHSLTNIYIINQSVLDLVVSVILVCSADVDSAVPWPGLKGDAYCKIWQSKLFLWGFLVSSTYNLVCLTVERYLQVCHPIWHKTSFNHQQVQLSIVTVWLVGPLFNAAYMIPSSVVIDGQCAIYTRWPSPLSQKLFGLITILIQFLIPLVIMVYCYSYIAVTLHRKIKVDAQSGAPGQAWEQDSRSSSMAPSQFGDKWHRGRRNTIRTLTIVAACFVACWSWNQILFLLNHLGHQADFTSNFYHFTVIAVFLNSVVNPVVYAFKYQPFQRAAKSLFCKFIPGHKVSSEVTTIQVSSARSTWITSHK